MEAKTTCEECGGEGYTYEDRADSRGEHYTRDTACDACDGTGDGEAEAVDPDDVEAYGADCLRDERKDEVRA